MHRLTMLVVVALGLTLVPGAAAATDPGDPASRDLEAAKALLQSAAAAQGWEVDPHGQPRTPEAPAVPAAERGLLAGAAREATVVEDPCLREQWADPAGDVPDMDVVAYSAAFFCDDNLWLHAALTDDAWPDEDLGFYLVDMSTTGDPRQGCEGFDHLVLGWHEQGDLFAGVVSTPACDSDTWSAEGPAFIGRAGADDFIWMGFGFDLIGSPPVHWFYGGLAHIDGEHIDFFPDDGVHEISGYPLPEAGPEPPPADVSASCPDGGVPPGGFTDTAGSIHRATIDCIAWWGLARGVTPTDYAPRRTVTRAQMATFVAALIRAADADLPPPTDQGFTDVAATTHADAINQLAAAGVVAGTSQTTYHPARPVRRDQMTTFLVAAYRHITDTELTADHAYFDDTASSAHRANIDAAAQAGFTSGTGPRQFSPAAGVRRDQMASFLARTLNRLVTDGEASPPG